jgi:integrase
LYTSLAQAIKAYQSHLESQNLKPNTIKNRTQPLRLALEVLGSGDISRITGSDMDSVFAHYDWAPRTRNLYLSSYRSFFKWCRHSRLVPRDFDPTITYSNRRIPRTQKQRVPVDNFGALLDACSHPRDRATVALGLYTFLRGSELQTLQIQDVDFSESMLRIYRHKTEDEDHLPICTELRDELTRWLNWYREDQRTLVPNWYLLPSKRPNHFTWVDGKRVQVSTTPPLRPDKMMTHPYRPAKRALASLGLDAVGEGEHTLRRSGARALFDTLRADGHQGALMRVSSMLGHRDTRITEHYIGLDAERVQRNELLAGKPMFKTQAKTGLRVVGGDG